MHPVVGPVQPRVLKNNEAIFHLFKCTSTSISFNIWPMLTTTLVFSLLISAPGDAPGLREPAPVAVRVAGGGHHQRRPHFGALGDSRLRGGGQGGGPRRRGRHEVRPSILGLLRGTHDIETRSNGRGAIPQVFALSLSK